MADTGFGSGLCTNQPALEVVEASLNSGLKTPVSLYSPPKLREENTLVKSVLGHRNPQGSPIRHNNDDSKLTPLA